MGDTPVAMVVDDYPGLVNFLTEYLDALGLAVVHVNSVTAAIQRLEFVQPALFIIESRLRDAPGKELCRYIRGTLGNTHVPIMMMTAKNSSLERVEGLEAGADDYITKPFSFDELALRLRKLWVKSKELHSLQDTLQFMGGKVGSANNIVEMRFDFPEVVKVPCEQYLLYFVEFLRDIGIKATAELTEDAGQVLFAVMPDDRDEALDNIREALEIYLRLPASRNAMTVITPETSIEVQKLSAQLSMLQSQFYLANAALQQKELTLQQRDATIHQQQILIEQHLATGKLLVQSLQTDVIKEGDAEPVAGQIIKVKRWEPENIPVDVDLPALIRWLKEKFDRRSLL